MMNINYVIVNGSARKASQSIKVSEFIQKKIRKHNDKIVVNLINLAEDAFPLWHEDVITKGMQWNESWEKISITLQEADAIIIVSPEWNGMISPQLLNFFHLCTNQELSHKPGLIISISSGEGGAYPASQIRMNTSKNTRICYIPETIIIRNVTNVLNDFEIIANENDRFIRDRLKSALELLNIYTNEFKKIRNHDSVKKYKYLYGM